MLALEVSSAYLDKRAPFPALAAMADYRIGDVTAGWDVR